ncbi:hypothetical protein LCGC14_1073290, partial [marine sediment metagenome]
EEDIILNISYSINSTFLEIERQMAATTKGAKGDRGATGATGPMGPAGGGTPAPSPAPTGKTHTVVPGDSLGAVALKYKSGWPAGMNLWGHDGAAAKLASYNGIDVNGTLHKGQVLRIPW